MAPLDDHTPRWEISGEPQHLPGGGADHDAIWWKWWLRRGTVQSFTVVKASEHALLKPETMSARSIEAVDTCGRSEVIRHLGPGLPPRVIELPASGEPRVTPRGDVPAG